jgi:hypothetical protein
MGKSESKIRWKRIVMALVVGLSVGFGAWLIWEPGERFFDGRHDRGRNGVWLQHGWLGDDDWFVRNQKENLRNRLRSTNEILQLAALVRDNGITDVFPHLCPSSLDGQIAPYDPEQVERFLDGFEDLRVIPWIGGVLGLQARIHKPEWRLAFVGSVTNLLLNHPRLAGVHVNIEPLPSGNQNFLLLLEQLSAALPDGRLLSVAAYPPPTRWQPVLDVHWEENYFRQVASRSDQMVVMMYDTALGNSKLYRQLMKSWTVEVLEWSDPTPVLLGVPAYDDAGAEYHDPQIENLENAIRGIHAGLTSFERLPVNFQGLAIYSEWEMEETEWDIWRSEFEKSRVDR